MTTLMDAFAKVGHEMPGGEPKRCRLQFPRLPAVPPLPFPIPPFGASSEQERSGRAKRGGGGSLHLRSVAPRPIARAAHSPCCTPFFFDHASPTRLVAPPSPLTPPSTPPPRAPTDLAADYEAFKGVRGPEKLDPSIAGMITKMWKHSATQAVFERRSEFQLNDSADYYFNDVDRLAVADYLPEEQDVLRSRVRTTGIVQSDFVIKSMAFAMFDVGGQRNERRKWIHAFDNVNAVVFVAALSEYDQVLFEDETMNRMHEALTLFDQIVNSKWFKQTSLILFLNKKDLFEMKLKKKPLKQYYTDAKDSDITDDTDLQQCAKYFTALFMKKNKNPDKSIYSHVTCATDTSNVRFVFNAVVAMIIEQNLKGSGLM
jgi:hypothetical protein